MSLFLAPDPDPEADDNDRLSYGLSTRLARTAPNENLEFSQWSIPAGISYDCPWLGKDYADNSIDTS